MKMITPTVAAAGVLLATPWLASTAWSAPCVSGPIASYETMSCDVGPVTFGPLTVTATGLIDGIQVIPMVIGNEFALEFNYANMLGSPADVTVTYTVSTAPGLLVDAFAELTGNPPAVLGETLIANGNPTTAGQTVGSISLTQPNTSQTISIVPPQQSLLAVKDQNTGVGGSASAMFNGFSVSGVPSPIVGAGLPGVISAIGALLALARRRRAAA
jgi:hypothetical protein